MACGTEQLGTMTVITGCGQVPCRCRVEQTCTDCGEKYEGRESIFRDPQCGPCFQKEILAEPLPDVPDDGVDALARWLS
jgi:hypothetical protein